MSGIAEFLIAHAQEQPVSFHMPGHKGSDLYRRFGYGEFLERFFDCDITEIPGADNLFQPEDIIAETMDKYRRLYDTNASYLLVNGTSGGIIASILATVPAGKKLIMARNCHKSVFNALTLGGIQPVYAYSSEIEEYGISGPVEAEEIARLLEEHPEAEAVILPSPNYYGICSDIRAIAETVHAAGKILIVDQAHGAHLKFFGPGQGGEGAEELPMPPAAEELPMSPNAEELPMPPAAEDCGADLVIGSIHKTLGSLTQSAVLNVCSNRVSLYRLEDKLQAIESTSPSYLLMGSLDVGANLLLEHGPQLMKEWQENLLWFYARAKEIPGLRIMSAGTMDLTKINLDMSACGLDGGQLEEALMEQNIYAELVTGNILMCMTGIGNTRRDYERLLGALEKISREHGETSREHEQVGREHGETGPDFAGGDGPAFAGGDGPAFARGDGPAFATGRSGAFLWTKRRQQHPLPTEKELVKIDLCEGRVCAASIIPYPPGIPLICPGEEIGAEEIAYVKELRARGEKVMGIDSDFRIVVGIG